MQTFKQFISESINDRGIFKAIFVVGLPGAGKSYTVKQLKGAVSPLVVNTDRAAEFLGTKFGKQVNSESWKEFKDSAHRITKNSLKNYLNGVLPLFIDGTSNDVSNILHRIGILESIGYDVGVVFVHASLETAKRRAAERAKISNRAVDEHFIEHVYKQNKENAAYLKSKVSFFKEVENDTDGLHDAEMNAAFKKVQAFFDSPIQNPVGKRNFEKMKEEKQKYLSPTVVTLETLEKKVEGWYKQ